MAGEYSRELSVKTAAAVADDNGTIVLDANKLVDRCSIFEVKSLIEFIAYRAEDAGHKRHGTSQRAERSLVQSKLAGRSMDCICQSEFFRALEGEGSNE
jgi:hypothetical protein